MSKYFEFIDDYVDPSGDDFTYESKYFEFLVTPDPSGDDFTFVGSLYTFDAPVVPPTPPPEFVFDPAVVPETPTGVIYDISNGILLSFKDPKTLNPFNAKKVSGLDASNIFPRYYRANSGDKFYTLSLEGRQIIFLIGLNPDWADNETYSLLRDKLFKVISLSKTGMVDILFRRGEEVVAIVRGFAMKVDTDLFLKDQVIQLTVNCDDPMLRGPEPVVIANPVIFEDVVVNDQKSTAPHGFTFKLTFNGNAPNLEVVDPTDDSWFFRITPVGGFLNGDQLLASSDLNQRKLYILRAGVVTELMPSVVGGSIWPIIFPGENHFSFISDAPMTWTELSYYETYWGV